MRPSRIAVFVALLVGPPTVSLAADGPPRPEPRVAGMAVARNRALAERILAHDDVPLPKGWPGPAAPPAAGRTAVVRGRGYATCGQFERYPDDPARVHGVIWSAVPGGDLVYWLGPPRWLALTDDRGNELSTAVERAAAEAEDWWKGLAIEGSAVRDDHHDGLLNFELQLPAGPIKGFGVARGCTAVLMATGWDTVIVPRPGPAAPEMVFKTACVKGTWPDATPPDKRAAYAYRLEPTEGFEPNLWTHFDDPFVAATAVGPGGRRRPLDGGVWSRQSTDNPTRRTPVRSKGWLYTVNGPLRDGEVLELKMLAGVAIVRLPFDFRGVTLPDPRGAAAPAR